MDQTARLMYQRAKGRKYWEGVKQRGKISFRRALCFILISPKLKEAAKKNMKVLLTVISSSSCPEI